MIDAIIGCLHSMVECAQQKNFIIYCAYKFYKIYKQG